MTSDYAVPVPHSAKPLSRSTYTWACLTRIRRELPSAVRPRTRTPRRSQNEYDERWSRQAAGRRWESASDLEAAVRLSSYGSADLAALLDFEPYRLPAPDFFGWRAHKLAAFFDSYRRRGLPVTEIGCGLGKNLLALALAGHSRLSGYDPTPAAVAAVQQQAQHFGLNWRSGRFDLLAPDRAVLEELRGQVLFTNHVLEQLPRDLPRAFETLLAARPAEVVHLEPCRELLRPTRSLADLSTLVHMHAVDYQRTMLTHLIQLQAEGRLKLEEVARVGYSPTLAHDPVFIRWCPT